MRKKEKGIEGGREEGRKREEGKEGGKERKNQSGGFVHKLIIMCPCQETQQRHLTRKKA